VKNTRQIHASIIQHAKLQVIRNSDIYTSKDHIFQSNTQHFTNKNNKKKSNSTIYITKDKTLQGIKLHFTNKNENQHSTNWNINVKNLPREAC
jgi:hypothetical protein